MKTITTKEAIEHIMKTSNLSMREFCTKYRVGMGRVQSSLEGFPTRFSQEFITRIQEDIYDGVVTYRNSGYFVGVREGCGGRPRKTA